MTINTKTIFLGLANMNNYWGNPNAVPDCPVYVDIELKNKFKKPTLSITATIYNPQKTDIICAGQCLDTIAATNLGKTPLFQEIYDLWKKHHLNDMHAGTPAQEKALRDAIKAGILPATCDYTKQVAYLKSINLYTDKYTETIGTNKLTNVKTTETKDHCYGCGWLYQPIPTADLARIQKLLQK